MVTAISPSLAPLHVHHGGDRGVHGGVHGGVHENDVQDDRDGSAGGEVGDHDGFVRRAWPKSAEENPGLGGGGVDFFMDDIIMHSRIVQQHVQII